MGSEGWKERSNGWGCGLVSALGVWESAYLVF
jgi:hypothetical protein